MIIRPEHPGDHPAIDRLLADAFGGPAEARLVARLRSSPAFVPELALVGEVDGAVVGQLLLTMVRVEDRETRASTAALALAPMAVAPAYQRGGIGTALVVAGLERAEARPEAAVVVLGHPAYYPRFGFEPASAFAIVAPWPDVPDEAFLVRPLPAYTDRCRGVVVYPPPFDEV